MTNEKQKPTTNEYLQNWDEIFDKNLNEEKEKTVNVDIEAENGNASITVTKTWSF